VDKKAQERMEPITIDYWRAWDGKDDFEEIIKEYNKIHPNITINYRKLRYEEYEEELINALAEDRGPDIFSIQNTWIKKYQNKITPLPEKIEMAYPVEEGAIEKRVVPVLKTKNTITLKELQNKFVDAVYHDVVLEIRDENDQRQKKIFGLPLYMDTLAMFYNRDLLNNAGIAEPPQYWNREFQEAVKKLTKQDTKGRLIQSGVALGGSDNVQRPSDILSLLMMQNGAVMIEDNGVQFHKIPAYLSEQNYNPGLEALRFYTDFANPAKEVYCWNNTLDDALDLFAQGKLAIMFGYAYHEPMIEARSPKLNFSVAGMPQIEGSSQKMNYANYWVEVVSQKSEHIQEAWDFVHFATTDPEMAKTYLEKTKKPTALRSLVNEQVDDIDIGVFAEQVLTAQSWYKGAGPLAAEEAIKDMIKAANKKEKKLEDVIQDGANRVQQTLQ
jgi:multiple sugar transport system substrate-binding protein